MRRLPSAPPSVEDVLGLSATCEEELLGEAHPSRVARLRALGPHLVEALDWSAEHDPERGLSLAAALWRYWVLSDELRDGRQQLSWLLSLVPASSVARLHGLVGSALLASFALAHEEAVAPASEAMPLARALDDELRLGYLELVLARSAQARGDLRTAAGRFEEALERFRDARQPWGTATTLLGLGEVARAEAELPRAHSHSTEALGLFQRLADEPGMAASRLELGLVSLELGAREEAQEQLAEAARMARALEKPTLLAVAALGLAALRRVEGRPEAAARLLGESQALVLASGHAFEPAHLLLAEREEAKLRRTLGARYESEWRRRPEPADRERLVR